MHSHHRRSSVPIQKPELEFRENVNLGRLEALSWSLNTVAWCGAYGGHAYLREQYPNAIPSWLDYLLTGISSGVACAGVGAGYVKIFNQAIDRQWLLFQKEMHIKDSLPVDFGSGLGYQAVVDCCLAIRYGIFKFWQISKFDAATLSVMFAMFQFYSGLVFSIKHRKSICQYPSVSSDRREDAREKLKDDLLDEVKIGFLTALFYASQAAVDPFLRVIFNGRDDTSDPGDPEIGAVATATYAMGMWLFLIASSYVRALYIYRRDSAKTKNLETCEPAENSVEMKQVVTTATQPLLSSEEEDSLQKMPRESCCARIPAILKTGYNFASSACCFWRSKPTPRVAPAPENQELSELSPNPEQEEVMAADYDKYSFS